MKKKRRSRESLPPRHLRPAAPSPVTPDIRLPIREQIKDLEITPGVRQQAMVKPIGDEGPSELEQVRAVYAKKLLRAPLKALLGGAKLKTRQRLFVTAYVSGPPGVRGIAKRSAEVAGYKSDPGVGDMLVKSPAVKAELAKYLARWDRKAQDVIDELHRVAFADQRDVAEWDGARFVPLPSDAITDDAAASIAEVSVTPTMFGTNVKVKQHDKLAALGLLAKFYKLVDDRVQITGKNGGPIELSTYVYLPQNGRELDPAQVRPTPDDVIDAQEVRAIPAQVDPALVNGVVLPPSGRENGTSG